MPTDPTTRNPQLCSGNIFQVIIGGVVAVVGGYPVPISWIR